MTQKSKRPAGRKSSALKKTIRAQKEDISPFHLLTKKDIEKEISQIEKKFGMKPEEFHTAWKEGKLHGHVVTKLGCYYEIYKDEYE